MHQPLTTKRRRKKLSMNLKHIRLKTIIRRILKMENLTIRFWLKSLSPLRKAVIKLMQMTLHLQMRMLKWKMMMSLRKEMKMKNKKRLKRKKKQMMKSMMREKNSD